MKKKNEVLRLLDFKTYYKVTVINAVWYRHRPDKEITGARQRVHKQTCTRETNQFLTKTLSPVHREREVFLKGSGQPDICTGESKPRLPITSHTNINLSWILEINVKPRIYSFCEKSWENIFARG